MRFALILSCLLLTGSNATADADFATFLPGVGRILVDTSIKERRDDHLAEVRFRDEQGTELLFLRFLQFGPGDVTFQEYTGPGLPAPTVFVASSYARADGVNVDLVAVGVVDGALRKLFALTDRDLQDAVCISADARDGSALVVLARFLEGDYCFMCWPKRFEIQEYRWQDATLSLVSRKRTQRLHPDWSSALAEKHVQCGKELFESTVVPDDAEEGDRGGHHRRVRDWSPP